MKVYVEARVEYTCELSEEDEKRVRERAEEKGLTLTEAIGQLYALDKIELYNNFVESDFDTLCILAIDEDINSNNEQSCLIKFI